MFILLSKLPLPIFPVLRNTVALDTVPSLEVSHVGLGVIMSAVLVTGAVLLLTLDLPVLYQNAVHYNFTGRYPRLSPRRRRPKAGPLNPMPNSTTGPKTNKEMLARTAVASMIKVRGLSRSTHNPKVNRSLLHQTFELPSRHPTGNKRLLKPGNPRLHHQTHV